MNEELKDKVTEFSEAPDMAALHNEYDSAWAQDPFVDGRIAYVESIRYARWGGQSEDGLAYRDRFAKAGRNCLYDGAPDTRIFLADDIINHLVAVGLTAYGGAKIKTSPTAGRTLNAAQAGELFTLVNWLKNGPMKAQLDENIEIAFQLMCMVGWCVLHPTWRNKKALKMQRLSMEQIFGIAHRASQQPPSRSPTIQQDPSGQQLSPTVAPQNLLASLPEMVLDPELEDAAVEMFLQFFPGFDKREARRVIRELRVEGEAEFPTEKTSSVGPELGVLCPWVHFILPTEATTRPADARAMFVLMKIPLWRIDELAASEEWTDEKFIEKLKATAGEGQQPPTTKEDLRDENRNLCDVVYAFRRVVKDGAAGIYCTVMSPQVTAETDGSGGYGRDWNLDLAHGEMPFKFLRMEAADWCVTDTRGVCDVVMTSQMEMKQQRDGVFVQSQLSNTPPIMRLGTSASKVPPEFGPFSIINAPSGKPWEVLNLTGGSKPELAIKITEMVRKEAEDYFGLPRGDTPPQRSQLRLQKFVTQWLAQISEAIHQLVMLAYQNMDADELADILGHKPLLTAEIVARHKVLFSYDVRVGDGEFIDRIQKTVTGIISAGLGNDLMLNKVVSWWMNFLDPAAAQEFLPEDDTSSQQALKDVRGEIDSMALGNKPILTQMDPAAKKKMGFAQQIVQQNPNYQLRLTPKINGMDNPHHDPSFLENFTTYMKNLQHSYQETTLSKAQGRLGVKDVGQTT